MPGLTVGELRKVIDRFPDNMLVFTSNEEGYLMNPTEVILSRTKVLIISPEGFAREQEDPRRVWSIWDTIMEEVEDG
jgi:hypothetical protein